ncbi:MAG: hypothetical protein O4805_11950 [Trichodesmium sp. St16_bin2-tuft]|nr:hypothetical protein [Trichodesmium sp. St18_bin1]MDE5087807.1 hypothetical protein [Trichodesmium sp. St16_bin2-tuft]MDE5105615.1 hypothetical protein [Trichodesmium sp. St17_bin3_1_1]MDE5122330.1 hypothetical protein [Trichodesmium sp. St19_bin1]
MSEFSDEIINTKKIIFFLGLAKLMLIILILTSVPLPIDERFRNGFITPSLGSSPLKIRV